MLEIGVKNKMSDYNVTDARGRSKVTQGSLTERINTGIKNRQNFKARKKAWGVEDARKAFDEDVMKQRIKRTKAKNKEKI